MKTAYTDNAYGSFIEENLGDLTDKEGFAVLLGTDENTVKLATDAATALASIGVVYKKFGDGAPEVSVRFFGKGGTLRGVAGGIISKGAMVKVGTDSRFVVTLDPAEKVGRYLGQEDTAVGQVIEILD